MCGIVGFTQTKHDSSKILEKMISSINHRGPDSNGIWFNDVDSMALGHARLSIQDLSEAGSQPMKSPCGRYIIVFNGEIYNHMSLRLILSESGFHINWKGHSDTETLLACVSTWGLRKTLDLLVGMFSFALWDRELKNLTLGRDRLGEKPLYWGWAGDTLIFASELKAIKLHPEFSAIIDRSALKLYLQHCYVPAPLSIYQGISKLLPGHFVEIPLTGDIESSKAAIPLAYWSLDTAIANGKSAPFQGDFCDAVSTIEDTLRESIIGQVLADVEVGAFLSGGIDSSLVVALMQQESSKSVNTFTIGFNEVGYNEAEFAKQIAQHLGTNHTELYVSSEDAMSVIPKLSNMFCEPFGDSSQIPTFLVSQLAKNKVTVALSGDGGDEIFGGYNRYLAVNNVWRPSRHAPQFFRRLAAYGLGSISPLTWDNIFKKLNPLFPKKYRVNIAGEKARKLSEVLSLDDDYEFYRQVTSHWSTSESVVIESSEENCSFSRPAIWDEVDCLEHAMMAMDTRTYLCDDILTKVDRAAMATSLETRVPLLDHRLVELAWKMPIEFKIRKGQGKCVLREVLYKYVPKELIERPKAGFGIPLGEWLRGPLREWADDLIDEIRLIREGYFYPNPIREKWAEHLSGRRNWEFHLWNILMFQAWLQEQ